MGDVKKEMTDEKALSPKVAGTQAAIITTAGADM